MGSENEIQRWGASFRPDPMAAHDSGMVAYLRQEETGDAVLYADHVASRKADQERIAWLERRGDSLAATVAEVCDELSEEGWRINRLHDALTEYRASLPTGETD